MWRRVAGLVVMGGLAAACGSPLEDASSESQQAIHQGARELGEPWVVMVYYQRPGTTKIRLCTGSVVARRVVLTAKHCVFDEPAEDVWVALAPSAFTVAVGHDYVTGVERELGVARVVTTPGVYASAQARSGDDLALLELGADAGVAPKPVALVSPVVGDPLRIVGFGLTEADTLGAKHAGAASVSAVGAATFESDGPAWTCTGDSGGPALHAAREELIGVTSYGPSGCDIAESYYTRVDVHAALFAELGVTLGGGVAGTGAGGSGGEAAGGGAGGAAAGGAGATGAPGPAGGGASEEDPGCAVASRARAGGGARLVLTGLALGALGAALRRRRAPAGGPCASS